MRDLPQGGRTGTEDRVTVIQNNTAELLRKAEGVIVEAIDAINAAKAAGATEDQLQEALQLQRRATSTGTSLLPRTAPASTVPRRPHGRWRTRLTLAARRS